MNELNELIDNQIEECRSDLIYYTNKRDKILNRDPYDDFDSFICKDFINKQEINIKHLNSMREILTYTNIPEVNIEKIKEVIGEVKK